MKKTVFILLLAVLVCVSGCSSDSRDSESERLSRALTAAVQTDTASDDTKAAALQRESAASEASPSTAPAKTTGTRAKPTAPPTESDHSEATPTYDPMYWKQIYLETILAAQDYAEIGDADNHRTETKYPLYLTEAVLADLNIDGEPELILYEPGGEGSMYARFYTIFEDGVKNFFSGPVSGLALYRKYENDSLAYGFESGGGDWEGYAGAYYISDGNAVLADTFELAAKSAAFTVTYQLGKDSNGVTVIVGEDYTINGLSASGDEFDGLYNKVYTSQYERLSYEPLTLTWDRFGDTITSYSESELAAFLDSYTHETAYEQPLIIGDFSMAFGFANEDGDRLIIKYDEEEVGAAYQPYPQRYTLAIGPYNERIPIQYEGWQNMTELNNYRDSADNFDNLPGYVYAATDGELKAGQTYCLINAGTLDRTLIPLVSVQPPPQASHPNITPPNPELDEGITNHIKSLKNRNIIWTEQLALTEDGEGIGLVLYERLGDNMLFSIVYTEGTEVLFWDCETLYTARDPETNSTWVPGMGDQPGMFTPLFLARLDTGLLMGLTWSGPFGESIVLLLEDNGRFIDRVDYDYVYRLWAD